MIVFCDIKCDCTEVSARSKGCCGQNPMCSGSSLSQSIHEHILIEVWTVRSEIFHDRAFIQTSDDSLLLFLSCPSGPLLPCSLLAASHKHTHTYTHCSLQMSCMPCSLSCHTPLYSFILFEKTPTNNSMFLRMLCP